MTENAGVYSITVPNEGTTVTMNLEGQLPFAVSQSYANAVWQFMRIRPVRNGNEEFNWVSKTDAVPYTFSAERPTTDEGLWAFVGNVVDGFKIYNKAAGEDNSAKLVAEAFAKRGVKARYAGPKETGMILEGESGNATLNPESYRKLAKAFADFEGIVVYPGFFGYRKDGTVATFPRGGSDITGSILAAAIRADVYENFTDVDNVYPVDPRIVPEVKEGIDTMTYQEMRELAYAGFGVFNDEAIFPAVQARIPINVRNTNHPNEPGTMIVQSRRVIPGTVTGIAAADGFCNIIIDKYCMNREVGFTHRLLDILQEEHVSYEHIPSGIDSISVVIRAEKFSKATENRVVARIKRELSPDSVLVTHNYAILMVVGEGMAFSAGMLAKATAALAEHGINISMVNQGASEFSFMIGIKSEDRVKAVRALYSAYFG